MSPKFLFCLPLRLGVFIISLVQFLIAGAVAAFFWWALWFDSKNASVTLVKSMRITVIVIASIYSCVALLDLTGFIGAIFRKYKFIKTYLFALYVSLCFQIAAGVWYLVVFYTTRNQTLYDCLKGTTDQTKIDYCNALQDYKKYPQGWVIATAVVPVVLQLYACYVVHSYSRLLEHQNYEKHHRVPVYQPVRHQEDYPLTHNVTYPYADAPHSFGNKV